MRTFTFYAGPPEIYGMQEKTVRRVARFESYRSCARFYGGQFKNERVKSLFIVEIVW